LIDSGEPAAAHASPTERDIHLTELASELKEAQALDVEALARDIQEKGFRCTLCGRCCRGRDLSVLAFPGEIRQIMDRTGRGWLEVAEPPSSGEWDREGNFHTLEWRLKKEGGNCQFYEGDCRIYSHRPLICRTYPFFLTKGGLQVSMCEGLGREMEPHRALELAAELKQRYIRELEEALELISNFKDFKRGLPSREGSCLVHDSEGLHHISWNDLTGMLDRLCPSGRELPKDDW